MSRYLGFFDTMRGRIFLILVLGIAFAGATALNISDAWRRADLARARLERPVDRVQNFVTAIRRTDVVERPALAARGTEGVNLAPVGATASGEDARLARLMDTQLEGARFHKLQKADNAVCNAARPARFSPEGRRGGPGRDGRGGFDGRGPGRGFGRDGQRMNPPQCWLAELTVDGGETYKIAVDTPPSPVAELRAFDPLVMAVLGAASALLAALLAAMTGRPLNRLAEAAHTLGRDLNRDPLPEKGPREVREASQAFNAMQTRLRQNLAERTHMLAAITHDLQTPLTRLRLRLEKVKDETLRNSLIGDLNAMQSLIKEGLDLARSAESDEPVSTLNLDSLIESLVDDEAGAGRPVTFTSGCGCDVPVQVQAISRCLSNLIDNAIVYGELAEVSATKEGSKVVIRVRDQGPGIPEDQLDAVFEPLFRLEDSRSRETGGTGLGLAIARRLAEKAGTLILRNHHQGGCEAVLTLPLAR